jgi:hypothetical protein
MPNIISRCTFQPGETNNYAIAGNICNAFALGELGAKDDFFLLGAEPSSDSPYPLLTGNILDSEGNVLFRLVRNVIIFNPGHCSKIAGDLLGYEIHDSAGVQIFKVRTVFEKVDGLGEECFITTLAANFCNKNRELVFEANSGDAEERIVTSVKSAFGFTGNAFAAAMGMSNADVELASIIMATHGAVHEVLTGHIVKREITLDGKAITDAKLADCTIHVSSGDFVMYGPTSTFTRCSFLFEGHAAMLRDLVLSLVNQDSATK